MDLFPHLESWISPEIAIKVSVIVNKIYKEEFNRLLEEKTNELHEKDRQLEQKEASIQEIRHMFQQQQAMIQQINQTTEQTNQRTGVLVDQNTELSREVAYVRRDLSVMTEAISETIGTRVIMTDDARKRENLVIFKLNDTDSRFYYA